MTSPNAMLPGADTRAMGIHVGQLINAGRQVEYGLGGHV
jgi:hypothetical protein